MGGEGRFLRRRELRPLGIGHVTALNSRRLGVTAAKGRLTSVKEKVMGTAEHARSGTGDTPPKPMRSSRAETGFLPSGTSTTATPAMARSSGLIECLM